MEQKVALDTHEIETKWQTRWSEAKLFEANPKIGQPKFFCTFPYPYVNGLPHVGHLFTAMRVEAFARYKRNRGYNVLFPQGWHCTGQPIVNAAQRYREGDEKQKQILLDFGVPENELPKFTDPLHWIEYFVPGYRSDWQSLGLSIDWRREFITTDLNPHYDSFIKWQFRKLKEKGYVQKGKHPVVWCPKEQASVSDHGRIKGEGETAQEFTLIHFALSSGENVPVATLRPETIDGVTNLWVNPNLEYVRATVDDNKWIISKPCADKLMQQEHTVSLHGVVQGKELIGKIATGPGGVKVTLLPASFPTADKGTGIVMSVPSDAPDDYIALRDLQHDAKLQAEYSLKEISSIKPRAIIDAGELGHLAAVKIVDDMKIAHQGERDKLEEAKKIVYKKGYYEGIMLAGKHKGEKVEVAKEKIKKELITSGAAQAFYELTGPVVCRCLTPCIVKIVSNQWFMMYNNEKWKTLAHEALSQMTLYPEQSRQQFNYVIDWLREWACTRSEGLGTHLPWDENWLIESLSDSTAYNSYYTISHRIKELPLAEVDDTFFDYVLLGKGEPKRAYWKELRESFTYWYPVDFRNSGKDLIQNHLAFMLFNHVAIWEKEPDKWPRGYGVNGWVTVDGQKMSKSLGNLIPVRKMAELYGADASRLTILNGGEGMDDPNWDTELARTTKQRLLSFIEFVRENYGKGREDAQAIDEWFTSRLHTTIRLTTEAMELANFRTALQYAWFEFTNTIKHYIKLTDNNPHKQLLSDALRAQIIMIQPYAPHTSEEAWEVIGSDGFASSAPWPVYNSDLIKPEVEATFDLIDNLGKDIANIQSLLKIEKLSSVTIIVAATWKYDFLKTMRGLIAETRNPGEIIKAVMATPLKVHGQDVTKLVPAVLKEPSRLGAADLTQAHEAKNIVAAANYLAKRFNTTITVEVAEHTTHAKANVAFPGKPAIVLS